METGKIILIIVSGLGIFHGLFLAALLWSTKASRNISNKLLSLLMILLSIRVGKSVLLAFTEALPILYVYLGLCLMLFIGPLFLLYCQALIKRTQNIEMKPLLHFVPGVVFMALSIPMQMIGFKHIPDLIAGTFFAIFYLHLLGYLLFSKWKVIRQAGSTVQISTWLNILFWGLLAIWFEYVLNLFEEGIPYILGPIAYSITVYCITYLAFKNKYMTLIHTVKYQTTPIGEGEAATLFDSIEKLMQEERIFLDPNLTLAMLGKRLKVSSQKLSMAVNSRSGSNFNEYVNRYRVAHAAAILKDARQSHLSIAAVAYDCGFNSLSSFNSAFKKNTGETPSAYRKISA
jgi:AraC-like DNA-binding protein